MGMSRSVEVLAVVACAAPLLLTSGPAAAADCSGTLRAQMNFGVASQGLVPPPDGLDYATQPPADRSAGDGPIFGIVRASRDDGCAVVGARASVASRDAGTTTFSTRRTGTTNSQGYIDFRVTPPRTTYLRGSVSVGEETATTPAVLRTVRTFVRAEFSSTAGCGMLSEGSTYPAKPHHPVWLQRRITQNGQEAGYLTLRKSVTDANGKFRVAYTAPCGADYALAAFIPASATNTAGRSLYVDLHVKATRG